VEDNERDRFLFAHAMKKMKVANSLQFVVDGQQAIDYFEGRGAYADRQAHPIGRDLSVLAVRRGVGRGHRLAADLYARGLGGGRTDVRNPLPLALRGEALQARERAFLKEDGRKGLKVRGMSLSCEPVETAVENR